MRFNVGEAVQLSVAAGANPKAKDKPFASLHSTVRSRLPATVETVGAAVSRTVIVCTKLALVFPHPSRKFQVRTRIKPFRQTALGVVESLTRLMIGFAVQLSVAAGTKTRAALSPTISLHSNTRSKEPAAVVTNGGLVSRTVIVWAKLELTLPHASEKFHVRTLT